MSGVQSIQRAFALMRALARGPAGVTELAERADLPKSTVARLLNALEEEGAVDQVQIGGDYRLGAGLLDLAGAAGPGRGLVASARPHLVDLKDQVGETAGVAVMDNGDVLYLDHVESEEEVLVRSWTGERIPLNVVPSGLVILADLPAGELDEYIANGLASTTDRSITDPDQLRSRLAGIREDGYCWVYAEFDESINSVAAPVRDERGRVIAAIHIHGPAYRFPDAAQADALGKLVRQAAENLSAQLR